MTTLFIEPGSPWEIRVLRELQLQDARRVPEHGALRDMVRGRGADEEVDTLQQREASASVIVSQVACDPGKGGLEW